MKYLSLFSGIGGFELGIQQAYEHISGTKDISSPTKWKEKGEAVGITEGQSKQLSEHTPIGLSCIGYSEIDKYACQIYQQHFPKHKQYGDITKINAEELPDFDFLCGGFPCQAFSIAGKRRGFEDTRGTLFFDIARILRIKQPSLLLLENVKGLLSHDEGRTFTTIISTLDELGYDIQWQVLNSKNHGVPQNRERVFIVGHLRGTYRPEVFPFGENDKVFNAEDESNERRPQTKNSHTLRGSNIKADQVFIRQVNQPKHSNERVYDPEGISPILNTMQGGQRQPKIINEDIKIRRLTPTECERLQGFPDGWTSGLSDTQRYKTLGNAVTVNVIRDIIKEIL